MLFSLIMVVWCLVVGSYNVNKGEKTVVRKLVEAQRGRSKAEVMLASATNKNSAGEGSSKENNSFRYCMYS